MSVIDDGQPIRPAPRIDASLVPLGMVRTAADFAECLDQLRVLAGPLSHREIEGRSGGRLRRTKIGQVLGGELPRREFLTAYLEVCGVPDAASEPWHQVWTRLVSTTQGRRQPAGSSDEISEDGDALVLRNERDAALAQVRRLTEQLETLASAAREAEADSRMRRLIVTAADTGQATMIVQVGKPNEPNEPDKQVIGELQTLRAERDAADRRARRLGELNDSIVVRLRTAETERDEAQERARRLSRELDVAQARITELTDTAPARQRPDKYTQVEADIYSPSQLVPPSVIGE